MMKPAPLWPILLMLAVLMALLGWVGWRYFYLAACKAPGSGRGGCGTRVWSGGRRWISRRPRPQAPARLRGLRDLFPIRRILWLLAPYLVVGLVAGLTLTFAQHFRLDPLRSNVLAGEGQAGLRLNQEKLLPPPTLPPSLFSDTQMPDLETADRDWSHLQPAYAQIVFKLLARMTVRGYPMALLEGYRSPERQDMLASKGSMVTHARAFQSKHQYGLAVDLAPLRDGKLVITERDPWARSAYQVLGEESEALGLTWGGRWEHLLDYGHVESPEKIHASAMAKG